MTINELKKEIRRLDEQSLHQISMFTNDLNLERLKKNANKFGIIISKWQRDLEKGKRRKK